VHIHIHGIVDRTGKEAFLAVLWRLQDSKTAPGSFQFFKKRLARQQNQIITTLQSTSVEIAPIHKDSDRFRVEGSVSLKDFSAIQAAISPGMWTTEDDDDVFGPLLRGEIDMEEVLTQSRPTSWPKPSLCPPK
jgi:hypothetical protein